MKDIFIKINISKQSLSIYENNILKKEYIISTAKNGAGEINGSEKTPRGLHVIRAKIGRNAPLNAIFKQRRFNGEIYSIDLKKKFPQRDWILTRILWLSGLEVGKNRLGAVDTMRRYIYIHGTPDEVPMGIPGSKGCIRMRNCDLIELFNSTPVATRVLIEE